MHKNDDLISRQAAIDKFEPWLKVSGYSEGELNMLKAVLYELRFLPSIQPEILACGEGELNVPDTNVGDMIHRQAAIEALGERPMVWVGSDYELGARNQYDADVLALETVPPAQPERKRGRWIYNSPVTMKCDQCGLVIKDWDWHRFKFCPNCDCDMRGEENG